MHLLQVVFVLSALLYSFYDSRWFSIFWKVTAGYFLLKFVYRPKNPYNTTRRMIQISTWGDPATPFGRAVLNVNVAEAQRLIASLSVTGCKITLTDVIAKAVALAVQSMSDLCGNIAFGLFFPSSSVNISLQLSSPAVEGDNIILLDTPASKKLIHIAATRELQAKGRTRENSTTTQGYPAFFACLPSSVLSLVVSVKEFCTSLALGLGLVRLPSQVLLTEVGYVGEMTALIAPPPDFRGPLTICASTVTDDVVIDKRGLPAIAPVVRLGISFDFRYFSGPTTVHFLQFIKDNIESPKVLTD